MSFRASATSGPEWVRLSVPRVSRVTTRCIVPPVIHASAVILITLRVTHSAAFFVIPRRCHVITWSRASDVVTPPGVILARPPSVLAPLGVLWVGRDLAVVLARSSSVLAPLGVLWVGRDLAVVLAASRASLVHPGFRLASLAAAASLYRRLVVSLVLPWSSCCLRFFIWWTNTRTRKF